MATRIKAAGKRAAVRKSSSKKTAGRKTAGTRTAAKNAARSSRPLARKAARKAARKSAAPKTAAKRVVKKAARRASGVPAVQPTMPVAATPPIAVVAAAAAAPAAAFAGVSPRRMNCKHVLDALNDETHSNGGDAAAADVIRFRNDPGGADGQTFGRVSSLPLIRWYIDPTKPDANQRDRLWTNVTRRIGRPGVANPGGFGAQTPVVTLQEIAEEAP